MRVTEISCNWFFFSQRIIYINIHVLVTQSKSIIIHVSYFIDFIVLCFKVDRTHDTGESQIIRTNELTKALHIKYNVKTYYSEVPEISKYS